MAHVLGEVALTRSAAHIVGIPPPAAERWSAGEDCGRRAAPPPQRIAGIWGSGGVLKRGAKLIDVRSAREYAHGGHPKGARSVPPDLIKKDQVGLARDAEILVICLSGHRSPRQAKLLAGKGYTNVSNVHGGLMAWKKAGLPVKN